MFFLFAYLKHNESNYVFLDFFQKMKDTVAVAKTSDSW